MAGIAKGILEKLLGFDRPMEMSEPTSGGEKQLALARQLVGLAGIDGYLRRANQPPFRYSNNGMARIPFWLISKEPN